MITEFLGKPLEYWIELESHIKEHVVDDKLFTNVVLENSKLKTIINRYKERFEIFKNIVNLQGDEE